jgi:hypothetical protein
VLRALLHKGTPGRAVIDRSQTPLMMACRRKNNPPIMRVEVLPSRPPAVVCVQRLTLSQLGSCSGSCNSGSFLPFLAFGAMLSQSFRCLANHIFTYKHARERQIACKNNTMHVVDCAAWLSRAPPCPSSCRGADLTGLHSDTPFSRFCCGAAEGRSRALHVPTQSSASMISGRL